MAVATLGQLARLAQAAPAAAGAALPRLWLFSDPVRLPDPLAAAARLPRGAGVVARGLAPAVLAALARAGAAARPGAGGGAAMGGPALAARGGLHLPDRRARAACCRCLLARRAGAPGALLTVAAHGGAAAAARARRLRPDLRVPLAGLPDAPAIPGAPALGPLRWAAGGAPAGACRSWRWAGVARGNDPAAAARRGGGRAAIGGLLPQAVARPPQCLR